jgi:hypothetical protein
MTESEIKSRNQGDVISYLEMCQIEGANLQKGMNFHFRGGSSILLMSMRIGAPYSDRIESDGQILIYEGHDIPKRIHGPYPKMANQELTSPSGKLTQNGLFYKAAQEYKQGSREPELVKVYEKIKDGIWVYNGFFQLIDSWQEKSDNRLVFKFKLVLTDLSNQNRSSNRPNLDHNRLIPPDVKLAVWKRDKGRCVQCGSRDNLHFDHIIPFSKGGSSLDPENIQILCARHNLEKRDKIR